MPKYFVCEEGPMGGCTIIAVGDTREQIDEALARLRAAGHNNLFLYEQVSDLES